jgi:hypothetical protein
MTMRWFRRFCRYADYGIFPRSVSVSGGMMPIDNNDDFVTPKTAEQWAMLVALKIEC